MATDTAPASITLAPGRTHYWQLPVFLAGLCAAGAAACFVPPAKFDPAAAYRDSLRDLSAALERKPVDPANVEPLVRTAAEACERNPESAATAHFLIGSGYAAMADAKPTEAADSWTLAAQHFSHCDPAALTPAEQAKYNFRSAKANAAIGRGDPTALILGMTAPPPGEERGECPRLIAECCLRLPTPDLPKARDELTHYLGGVNKATVETAARCKLKLADLNRRLNDPERAKRYLGDIGPEAPPAVLATAKVQLARMAAEANQWAEAASLFEAAQTIPGVPPEEKTAIRYQTGEALWKLGNALQAVSYFEQVAKEPGALGAAAALRMAEIKARDPQLRGHRRDAVDWLERAAATLPNDAAKIEARASFEEIIRVVASEADYAAASRAVTAYGMIAAPGQDRELRADVTAAWAAALRTANDAAAVEKARSAAADYLALAATATEKKADLLQKAVAHFRHAGDKVAALDAVNVLLATPGVPDVLIAASHLERADLLPATDFGGQSDALVKAMMGNGTTATAARLKLALLNIARGNEMLGSAAAALQPEAVKKEAEQTMKLGRDLLKQVAETSTVAADARAAHEQALFELGRLHLRDSAFAEADAWFRKQLSLYPTGPFAGYGRLWLVCALLQEGKSHTALDSEGRKTLDPVGRKALEDALAFLKPLTQSPDAYLQTYGEIWTLNTLLELGDAGAVVPTGKRLMQKYRGKPEELVAGKLMVYAYLNSAPPEPAEAARTLDRMEELFKALQPSAYPNDPEYSRAKWLTELPNLREQVRKAGS